MNKKLVNLIFGISLGILLLLCVMTFDRLSNFNKYTKIIDNSHKVLLAISNMRSGFNTSIAEQRSYLLTKDVAYYNHFQSEKDSLRHSIQLFKKLTRESKVHQHYIKKIEEQSDNRIQSLLLEIINDSSSAKYKYDQLELISANDEINKKYFDLLETVDNHEKLLLSRRLIIKEFEEQFTPFLLFILALIAMGIIIYSFVLIGAELKKRDATTKLLEESIVELNQSNTELEQYAYVASHDLQEPLRKIRLFSNKLLGDYGETMETDGRDMLLRMNNSAEKMTILIKDLLSLSTLSSENPIPEKVNLNDIVDEVEKEFEDVIQHEKINFSHSDLPSIYGYSGQLHQLFQNLIGNAIKFRRDDIPLEISVRNYVVTKWEGDVSYKYHHIAVRDNGRGFDNEFKNKMFTIFGRLDKTSDIDGTGIGLSICSRIMQNHEGELDAEGAVNTGATFHLYFPHE
ncbi:sensor histidine kinase [Arcticibacterium luteifluviistationis]|uniref:histidine kinase n=1 Tax=Arcticibacterium luteifluviistationis TaxID=1784714 RepID=A0A2Z4G9R9_9BACT|nr:sensor histidine kinase [Arcticibacterium luteifluviistationis]AWV97936.1 hypothetical protein DJ013_07040 [Arcticibacterium luteifluviistationis]